MIEVIRDINANLVELSDAIAAGVAPAIDAAASISQLRITVCLRDISQTTNMLT